MKRKIVKHSRTMLTHKEDAQLDILNIMGLEKASEIPLRETAKRLARVSPRTFSEILLQA